MSSANQTHPTQDGGPSESEDGADLIVLLIAGFAIFFILGLTVATFAIDITSVTGVDTTTSGAVSEITVDEEDSVKSIQTVFTVRVSESVEKVEIYEAPASENTLIIEDAVLPEERVFDVRLDGIEERRYKVRVYRDGDVVGSGQITVKQDPLQLP